MSVPLNLYEDFLSTRKNISLFDEIEFLKRLYNGLEQYINVIIDLEYAHKDRTFDQLILDSLNSINSKLSLLIKEFSTDTDIENLHKYLNTNFELRSIFITNIKKSNLVLKELIELLLVNSNYLKNPIDVNIFRKSCFAVQELSKTYDIYKKILSE